MLHNFAVQLTRKAKVKCRCKCVELLESTNKFICKWEVTLRVSCNCLSQFDLIQRSVRSETRDSRGSLIVIEYFNFYICVH